VFDGYPIPPCDCPPPGPVESFLGLVLVFWQLFFLALWLLPARYGDPIWKIAFPFMPRENAEPEAQVLNSTEKPTDNGKRQ